MPWYEEWFDREEYELVYRRRDLAEARRLVDLVVGTAEPARDARILDVGCGRGRHARLLASRGYSVTGMDLSEHAIRQARKRAAREGLQPPRLTFHIGDMRESVCDACFDGVINVFTAFGYFNDEADHLRAVRAMTNALKPGGWLVQDFLNAPYVRGGLVPRDVRIEDNVTITQRRWIERGRINKEIVLERDGDRQTFAESVRLFELEDFERLYDEAGLDIIQTFGDYDGSMHSSQSPRLILHARRV